MSDKYRSSEIVVANRSVHHKLTRVFIAMSFAQSMYNVWRDGIEKGIRDAGYEPIRMDNQEHNTRFATKLSLKFAGQSSL
jgi:hypothetical protein